MSSIRFGWWAASSQYDYGIVFSDYGSGRRGGEAMSINDLPAIMGTVLIVAGLALVGVSTWSRAEGSEKTTQAGALIIVVGAFLLGLSIFVSHGK